MTGGGGGISAEPAHFYSAPKLPLRQIAINAGQDGAVAVPYVHAAGKLNGGYNAATDTYEDLVASGVIDPTKVVRCGLSKAASVATLLLTTDALVGDTPDSKEKEGAGAGHGGHQH